MRDLKNQVKSYSNLYERILFSLPDIIFIFNNQCNFIEFYHEEESLLFLQPEEFVGKNILDVSLPDHVKKTTYKVVLKVLEDKQDRRFHYHLDMFGENRYFEARFFYLEDEKVFSIIRDISTIKKAETIQKQLKQYYQLILDRLDNGVVETDSKGKMYYANTAFLRISGSSKAQIIGKNFFEFFGFKKEYDQIRKQFSKKGIREKSFVYESTHLGEIEYRYFKISVIPSLNTNTHEEVFNITISDITEIKKKEEILHKSENTYRNLVESSPNGILIQDENKIQYINPSAVQILGLQDASQANDFNFKDFLLHDYLPVYIENFNELRKGGHVTYFEVKIRKISDKRVVELEVIPAKIYFEGKEVYQIVIKDISIQKHLIETKIRADLAEESYDKLRKEIAIRQEMEDKLSRSLEEKSILLKEVHHRVKNNLQIISSILNLEIRSQSDKKVNQALRRIQNRIYSIYLIHEIVYQTDMFSRIDLGHYIRLITENMTRNTANEHFKMEYDLEQVYVSLEIGVPIGMIINELYSNYFENHKEFESDNPMKVTLKEVNMQNELCIHYPLMKLSTRTISVVESSLSSQLIEALVDQINGNYQISNQDKKNIVFMLQF
jgi:PAS domain S-box-containing protein